MLACRDVLMLMLGLPGYCFLLLFHSQVKQLTDDSGRLMTAFPMSSGAIQAKQTEIADFWSNLKAQVCCTDWRCIFYYLWRNLKAAYFYRFGDTLDMLLCRGTVC